MSTRRDDGLEWRTIEECGCCGSTRSEPAGTRQGVAMRRCRVCATTRFAATVVPDSIYTDGYHDGTIDFGFNYEGDEAYEQAVADIRLDWLEARLAKGSVVDIGGGLGFFSARAAERGWDSTLVEPVAAAVEQARKRFDVRALQMGVDEVADSGEGFDLVTLNHAIEHFPAALDTLRRLRPVINEGGHLFIEVPNLSSLGRRWLGDKWMGWQAGEHVYVFTRQALTKLVERAGYEVVASGTFVPGWHGLLPSSYAHLLGIEGVLHASVGGRRGLRKLRHRARGGPAVTTETAETFARAENVRIDETTGLRRSVYTRGFDALARLEALTGLGTNVRVLARPIE